MRKTKSARQALARLAAYMGVELEQVSSTKWRVGGPDAWPKTTNRALAILADQAMRRSDVTREEVRKAVKWYGVPRTLAGVRGWELEALRWLRWDP